MVDTLRRRKIASVLDSCQPPWILTSTRILDLQHTDHITTAITHLSSHPVPPSTRTPRLSPPLLPLLRFPGSLPLPPPANTNTHHNAELIVAVSTTELSVHLKSPLINKSFCFIHFWSVLCSACPGIGTFPQS
ncbi:uncharacterized protein [Nothobranchius furzeri]|uniref:uncharacterized protein isoform X2 n=1 Tax=Nothobranchius furzeri TaxID=105023 RepID=UPI003904A3FA